MSDLADYTQTRARRDPEFAEGLEMGYQAFKIGVLRSGLTPEVVAERLKTKKPAISRIERHDHG